MGVGSVWLPIVVWVAMMALCCGGPCCWDDGSEPAAEPSRRGQG